MTEVRFAPVAPIHILEQIENWDPRIGFGDYHLFLAHHTTDYADRFAALINKHQGTHFGNHTYIMDNSLVELGGAVDDAMIAEAVRAVLQTSLTTVIPVLPDAMGDGAQTRALSEDAYHRWAATGMPGGRGYMVVAQGNSWHDFCDTVNYFFLNRIPFTGIQWVGIPRILTSTLGTRANAVEYVQMVAPHADIHLLGFSEDICDDLHCSRLPGVRGIDSAVPVRYQGLLTPVTSEDEIGPRGDWWTAGSMNQHTQTNLRNVRKWVRRTL